MRTLFGFRGRIGRLAYIGGLLFALALLVLLIWLAGELLAPMARILAPRGINAAIVQTGMWLAAGLLFSWMVLALTVKRLHDRGRSGMLAVAVVVPIVIVALIADLVFVPRGMEPPAPVEWAVGLLSGAIGLWVAFECLFLPSRRTA